jgi:hypothetical protein
VSGRFGPSRGEHRLRLAVSLAGLGMLGAALAVQGLPEGPGLVEVAGIAGVFFGGSAAASARALMRRPPAQDETPPEG